MPTRRETIYPEDLADRLNEYEKLLIYPAYGRWRTKRILKNLDLNTTTNRGKTSTCSLTGSTPNYSLAQAGQACYPVQSRVQEWRIPQWSPYILNGLK